MEVGRVLVRKGIGIMLGRERWVEVGVMGDLEFEGRGFEEVWVREVVFGILIWVEVKRVYIEIVGSVVWGMDGEGVSVLKMEKGFVEEGRGE